jgi:hypothetical protein
LIILGHLSFLHFHAFMLLLSSMLYYRAIIMYSFFFCFFYLTFIEFELLKFIDVFYSHHLNNLPFLFNVIWNFIPKIIIFFTSYFHIVAWSLLISFYWIYFCFFYSNCFDKYYLIYFCCSYNLRFLRYYS